MGIRRADVDPQTWAALTGGLTGGLTGATPVRRRPPPAVDAVAPAASLRLCVVVPLRLVPAANRREHFMAKARRVKAEAWAVKMAHLTSPLSTAAVQAFTHQRASDPGFRVRVTLTRLGGRRWDDDNNVSGLKAVRDAVAMWWLLADDGCPWVSWHCAQEPGGPVGVRIELEG